MNRLGWRASLWGLGLFLAAAGTLRLRAGDDFKIEDGYVSLFNGKDLSGWRYAGSKADLTGKTETPDKRFEVKDGVIVVNEKDAKGKGGIRDLYTVQNFDKDFHLKLEFRAAPRADSGVYIRKPQLQVRDYPTVGPYKKLKQFKSGGWNELDIVVRGRLVSTTVNGKAVSATDVLELTVKGGKPEARLNGSRVEVSKIEVSVGAAAECRCNGELLEKAMKVPAKGGIGLQAETGKFEFRRLRIKQMP
jgi:Domain of Unknown Function (DUF1080)